MHRRTRLSGHIKPTSTRSEPLDGGGGDNSTVPFEFLYHQKSLLSSIDPDTEQLQDPRVQVSQSVLNRLLEDNEPSVRYETLVHLLGSIENESVAEKTGQLIGKSACLSPVHICPNFRSCAICNHILRLGISCQCRNRTHMVASPVGHAFNSIRTRTRLVSSTHQMMSWEPSMITSRVSACGLGSSPGPTLHLSSSCIPGRSGERTPRA